MAKQCGECGHAFAAEVRELQQVDGELVEVQRQQQRRQQGTAQTLDDLRELAQQRGYKRGWAERVYQARLAKRHGV